MEVDLVTVVVHVPQEVGPLPLHPLICVVAGRVDPCLARIAKVTPDHLCGLGARRHVEYGSTRHDSGHVVRQFAGQLRAEVLAGSLAVLRLCRGEQHVWLVAIEHQTRPGE
jgi:hypothetical protein